MAWGGPYTATSWVNGTTPLSQTHLNNLETQYQLATQTFEQDLFTPFVLYGMVATKDASTANQLDVTAGVAFLLQTDSTVARQSISSSSGPLTTSAHTATYYLDLNPNGTYSFATSHSGTANYLTIAQVTTDGSGNISTVTDKRNLTAQALPTQSGSFGVSGLKLMQTSVNTYLGTVVGGVTYGQAGPVTGDTAALFNGTSGYIVCPTTGTLPAGNGAWSIECWFKTTAVTLGVVMNLGASSSKSDAQMYLDSTGHVNLDLWSSAIATTAAYNGGSWHHFVGTWDGTNAIIYIDGSNVKTSASLGPDNISYGTFSIGAQYNSGYGAFFNGSIAEVAIYTTTLSSTRVSAHYAAASSGYTAAVLADSPVRYYRLADVLSSTQAIDTIAATSVTVLDSAGNLSAQGALNFYGASCHIAYNPAASEVELQGLLSGVANGYTFISWTGSAAAFPFSVGAAGVPGATAINNSGAFTAVASQSTAGSFGVPVIVAQVLNTHITSTGDSTILTYAVPANGLYRINGHVSFGNGSSETGVIFRAAYTDPNLGTPSAFFMTAPQSGTTPIFLNGSGGTVGANSSLTLSPLTVYAKAGTNILVHYDDNAGTPNDYVTAVIERLA